MTEVQSDKSAGFTLIEALVALAILAIASAALITAAEAHVRRVDQVEDRARAQWVAQNHLAELLIGAAPDASSPVQMGGRSYTIAVDIRETDDPAILRVLVAVHGETSTARLATLDGFIPTEVLR